jgi:hypothetical protein
MKKTLAILALSGASLLTSNAQFIDLISFGTSGLGTADLLGSSFSQSANAVTVSGPVTAGDNFYGQNPFSSVNWTSSQGLWIKSSVTTASVPALSFTLLTLDSGGNTLGQYQGDTATFVSDGGFSYFGATSTGLTPVGTPILSGIANLQFTFDSGTSTGAGTANPNMQMLAVSTIPEPSTYALMALGGLVLFYIARRRKAQQV